MSRRAHPGAGGDFSYRRGLAQHQLAYHTHDFELLVSRQCDAWREVFLRELEPAMETFAQAMVAYVNGDGDFGDFCDALSAYRQAMGRAIDVAGRPVVASKDGP